MKKHGFYRIVSLAVSIILLLSCMLMASASTESASVHYKVNANGETYGNSLQADILGYDADLVFATGENGVVGYVRAEDLEEPEPSNPEEAALMQQQRVTSGYSGRYIPVYKEDGETVIGRFLVSFAEEEIPVARAGTDYTFGAEGFINAQTYTCTTRSGIKAVAGGVRGVTRITANKEVGISWLGARAFIYKKSNGSLVRSTSWYYNETKSSSFEQSGYHGTVLNTEYYSKGNVKTWVSSISDYWTTDTFASPAMKP